MEFISVLSISLALIPIIYVLWVSRKSIFRTLKKRKSVVPIEDKHNVSEYEKILKSVCSLENATQPNNGTHHPESVYIDRANRIRRETEFYNHINSLK